MVGKGKFDNEADFENHLREIISEGITTKMPIIYALKYKTVGDIVLCRDGANPSLFFLEVKYYQLMKGRLGFGNGSGDGIQPEILAKAPQYLESNLKWVFGSDHHSGKGYWLLSSDVVRNYVAGGSIGKKQNNLQEVLFRNEQSYNRAELTEALLTWLSRT